MTRVVAFIGDLMDRSRIETSIPEVEFASSVEEAVAARIVVVDLQHHADKVPELRRAAPDARLVCFGPHVDAASAAEAWRAGADEVLPRSRFFHDPCRALEGLSRER